MTLLTQPWSGDEATRLIASASHLSYGTTQSLARAVFFLGPFTLGAVTIEILSTSPANVAACARHLSRGTRDTDRDCPISMLGVVAAASQAAALVALVIYVAYTHGNKGIGCGSWPHALVAVSAISVTLAVAAFVTKALQMPRRLPRLVVCVLVFLALLQVAMALATVASWRGGLRPSGAACYLRISRWFGIFSLFPLLALLMAVATLATGVTHDRYRYSTSSKGSGPPNAPSLPLSSPLGAAERQQSNVERLYRSARLPVPMTAEPKLADPFQESFLKLNSCNGSIRTAAKANERSFEILMKYSACAFPTCLVLLCGFIVAFMDFSSVLTFAYHPLLIAVPAISANWLSRLGLGSLSRISGVSVISDGRIVAPGTVSNSPYVQSKLPLSSRPTSKPLPSRPSTATDSEGTAKNICAGRRAARFLKRQMGARSFKGAVVQPARRPSMENFTQRSASSTRPERLSPQSLLSAQIPATNVPADFFQSVRAGGPSTSEVTTMARTGLNHAQGATRTQTAKHATQYRSLDSLNGPTTSVQPVGSLLLPLTPGPRSRKGTSLKPSKSARPLGLTTSLEGIVSTDKPPFIPMQFRGTATQPQEPGARGSTSDSSETKHQGVAETRLQKSPVAILDAEGAVVKGAPYSGRNALRRTMNLLEGRTTETALDARKHALDDSSQQSNSPRRSSQLEPDSYFPTAVRTLLPPSPVSRPESSLAHEFPSSDVHEPVNDDPEHQPSGRHSDLDHSDGETSTHSRASSSYIKGRRPPKPPSAPSAGTLSIVDVDEDDLKRVLDARGFARPSDVLRLPSKEDRFQRALKLKAGAIQNLHPDDLVAESTAGAGAVDTAAGTEASFGLAEISHNPRLQRLNSMGSQRRNLFGTEVVAPLPTTAFLTQDQCQSSDESNASKPTAITESSAGSSGNAAGSSAGAPVGSSESEGFGSRGSSSHLPPGPLRTVRFEGKRPDRKMEASVEPAEQGQTPAKRSDTSVAAVGAVSEGSSSGRGGGIVGRIGVGERGALPEPPLPGFTSKEKEDTDMKMEQCRSIISQARERVERKALSLSTNAAVAATCAHRNAPVSGSEEDSSTSGSGSRGTFGGHRTFT